MYYICADDQGAAQQVQQTQAAVSQLQQANMQQLQQWHTEAVGYVQELEAIHEVLQQLVGHCMVEEQPKIAQASGGRTVCCDLPVTQSADAAQHTAGQNPSLSQGREAQG